MLRQGPCSFKTKPPWLPGKSISEQGFRNYRELYGGALQKCQGPYGTSEITETCPKK